MLQYYVNYDQKIMIMYILIIYFYPQPIYVRNDVMMTIVAVMMIIMIMTMDEYYTEH